MHKAKRKTNSDDGKNSKHSRTVCQKRKGHHVEPVEEDYLRFNRTKIPALTYYSLAQDNAGTIRKRNQRLQQLVENHLITAKKAPLGERGPTNASSYYQVQVPPQIDAERV